jgi:hypothetical protein
MQTNHKVILAAGVAALALAGLVTVLAAVPFTPNAQPVGYVGQPVVSNSNVASGTAKMYSIDYNGNDWSGNLHSYPVTSAGAIGAVDDWVGGASAQVKAQSVADTRNIVTMKNGAGIPFRWPQLSSGAGGQQLALDTVTPTAAATSPMVDYLRGGANNEGTGASQYRARAYGLGDMIHSTPVYWNDGTRRTVFVGANDGMLHAIDAADGSERFAYIPSMLMGRLPALANKSYTHQYFVDGRMDVKSFVNASNVTQTILAGTLGAGGKGLFGLDVTNAAPTSEADAAAKVLWEVTNASSGFADLGDTYAAPTLLTLPDGTAALVVGNGYNNTGNGRAMLYLVNARTGALIHAFDTGSGTASTSPNGLSSPSLWDTDGDGKKDTAYAGDIDGNLWKFKLVSPYTVTSLYTNGAGAAHAITMAPGLSAHPLGGVMVTFATGRMLSAGDVNDTADHYAYGIWDGAPAANDTLLEQTLTEASYTGVTPAIRVRLATANAPNWTPGAGHHKGWKTRLPIGGERVVGDGAFVTGSVFQFFSTNPTITPNAVPPGENWWMQLNVLTGGDTGSTTFDLNNDRDFTSDDEVGGRDPVGRHMGGGVRSQLIAISADGVDVFQSNYDKNSAPVVEPVVTDTTTVVTGDRGVSGGHFDFDVYCYTNCGDGVGTTKSKGYYYLGTNSETNTRDLNWTHVHEYDDIYDVTGVNLLAPSQGLFKVNRVKYGSVAATTGTPVSVPDTPTLAGQNKYPSTGVTVVSAVTDPTARSAKTLPSTTYAYRDGASSAVAGFPTSTATSTTITTTTKVTYRTTLTTVEAIATSSTKVNSKWPYNLKTTVRQWDTVVTTVSTTPVLKFKVLMANQAYSPAVTFTLTDSGATYDAKAFAFQNTAGLTAASLHTYRLGPASDTGALTALQLNMPLDAFKSKDWGTTVTRAGLHPTKADCVYNNPRLGPLGEWRNGALTIQLIDPSVADSDIQLNVTGHPELGYRLRASSMKAKLIAEYTIFWHHPNNLCFGDTGWTRTPPQDNSASDAVAGTKAEAGDPSGVFGGADNGTGSNPVLTPGTTTTTVTNANGSQTTTTVVIVANVSGGYTVTTTVTTVPASALATSTGIVTGGAVGTTGRIDTGGIDKNAATLGRITWREL